MQDVASKLKPSTLLDQIWVELVALREQLDQQDPERPASIPRPQLRVIQGGLASPPVQSLLADSAPG